MKNTLEVLINQAQEVHKNNTKTLGEILNRIDIIEKQLAATINKRDELIKHFHENLKLGMNMQVLKQYNIQIENMENIIVAYKNNINSCNIEHTSVQDMWYESYKVIKSYQLLYDQQQNIIKIKNNKIEQKNMDEYATRFFWYNQNK